MQVLLGESGANGWSSGTDKYSRLDREMQVANSHFLEEQQAQQQVDLFFSTSIYRIPLATLWVGLLPRTRKGRSNRAS